MTIKIFIAVVLSWISAQSLKILVTMLQTKHFMMNRLWGVGGMPSSHSAVTCALVVQIGHDYGLQSPDFALAVIFACVVMYDAMGVRRAAGEHAKILNEIFKIKEFESQLTYDKKLKENLGQTPVEVFAGALIGTLVSIAI